MQEIIDSQYFVIPKRGLMRLAKVGEKIKVQLSYVVPPMLRDLNKGKGVFREQATSVRNVVEAVLSDIHIKTVQSTKSFDDVYTKFGRDRNVISLIIWVLILLVSNTS